MRKSLAIIFAVVMALLTMTGTAFAAHTHEYEAEIRLPTCTEKGYTIYTCSCGDSYIGKEHPALGHKWNDGNVTKEPTCGDYGERTFRCTVCDATRTASIAPTGKHNFQKGVCTVCGEKDPCPSHAFTDVGTHGTQEIAYYYHDAIDWAVTLEITNGTSATTFSPDAGCTRAQAVTFLWRAAGRQEPKNTLCQFSDVDQSSYYYKAVLWAQEQGITTGTSATTFSPDTVCTRGQIVTFLWRSQQEPVPTAKECRFQDVDQGSYYYNAVLWAVEHNVTNGKSATAFAPDDTCTRAQIVTFFYRTAQDSIKD